MAENTENNEAANNRSIVDFNISYSLGVYTRGRKKGQPNVEKETITIIVSSINPSEIDSHLHEYCRKKNMQLLTWVVDEVLTAQHPFEFDCKHCGVRSINADPGKQEFCSRYCKEKAKWIF